jgi:hypothetical protein
VLPQNPQLITSVPVTSRFHNATQPSKSVDGGQERTLDHLDWDDEIIEFGMVLTIGEMPLWSGVAGLTNKYKTNVATQTEIRIVVDLRSFTHTLSA